MLRFQSPCEVRVTTTSEPVGLSATSSTARRSAASAGSVGGWQGWQGWQGWRGWRGWRGADVVDGWRTTARTVGSSRAWRPLWASAASQRVINSVTAFVRREPVFVPRQPG
ncbi:hypothetical protein QFZ49_005740 [Streptomyces turgidiscabies]|uniref:Uncharacterized protein n=1 Tax=Streptomyces turgidiscabies TaxID=85558 RepID=A0ABU0RUU3_9ACTN|nr:hypothetical protein [Streptomyces turgidiscabies]